MQGLDEAPGSALQPGSVPAIAALGSESTGGRYVFLFFLGHVTDLSLSVTNFQ